MAADREAGAGRFRFERAVCGFGRLFGGDDGSQYRGLQTFGYPTGDRQPGVGLERPDGGPGPGAEDAVHRSGVVAQPVKAALQSRDSDADVDRIGRVYFRDGSDRCGRMLFLFQLLDRRFPRPPRPGQTLRFGEFG